MADVVAVAMEAPAVFLEAGAKVMVADHMAVAEDSQVPKVVTAKIKTLMPRNMKNAKNSKRRKPTSSRKRKKRKMKMKLRRQAKMRLNQETNGQPKSVRTSI